MNKKYFKQLQKLVKETSSKHLGHAIKRNKNLHNYVLEETKNLTHENISLTQRIWHILNPNESGICIEGNNKKYISFRDGYRFCGPASICKCTRESVSNSVSKTKSAFTEEKKNKILKKRNKTNLEKYGSTSGRSKDQIEAHKKLYEDAEFMKKCNKKQQQTIKEKFGQQYNSAFQVPEIKKKIKETNIQHFGVENPMQSKEVQEKVQMTNLQVRGVKCPFQSDEVKQKILQTNRKNLNCDFPMQSKEVQEKAKKTSMKKYGKEYYTQTEENKIKQSHNRIKKYLYEIEERFDKNKEYKIISSPLEYFESKNKQKDKNKECAYMVIKHKCGYCFEVSTQWLYLQKYNPRCNVCDPYIFRKSRYEDEIYDFIKSIYKRIIIKNDRQIIKPLELDIVIPDLKIAFEIDGLYTHSENLGGKDRNYHKNKTNLCIKNNYRLIHIFTDEWDSKKDICQNRIKHILKLEKSICYARQTNIKNITYDQSNAFLDITHIQGRSKATYHLGAYKDENLVAVMTFIKTQIKGSNLNNYELKRFATKGNVPGIASKLFKYFIKEYKPNTIKSYCDLRWGTGDLYEKLGFTFSHISLPGYWYMRHYKARENRLKYQKKKLSKMFNIKFNLTVMTEWDIMKEMKYDRIWDCGNKVFIWNQ